MTIKRTLTFSQREGLKPLPTQLELRQLSKELRALIWQAIHSSLNNTFYQIRGTSIVKLGDDWAEIIRDYQVRVLHNKAHEFRPYAREHLETTSDFIFSEKYNVVFDFIEFVLQHCSCPPELPMTINQAFTDGRAAYRIVDEKTIVPVGNEGQAQTIQTALSYATQSGTNGAKTHLLQAGQELRNGNWAGSVRESISAVESVAVLLAPQKETLGAALHELEKAGHIHGALKNALSGLYGYTSDQEGVRHALVVVFQ